MASWRLSDIQPEVDILLVGLKFNSLLDFPGMNPFISPFLGLFLLSANFCARESIAANMALHLGGNGEHLAVDAGSSLDQLEAFTIEAYILFEIGGTDNPR